MDQLRPESEPTTLFRNLLVQLLAQPVEVVESETVEIKGWCKDEKEFAQKIVESASCIANAKGGAVLGGIGGKTNVFSSCPYPNVDAAWIEARVKDLSVPPVDCAVFDLSDLMEEVRGVRGGTAFGLVVPKSKFLTSHVTTSGVSKIRRGKECKPYFTAADDDRTRSFVNGVTEKDLSLTSLQWAISRHRSKFGVRGTEEDPFDFLARMRLIEPADCPSPTESRFRVSLAALLLFGKEVALSKNLSNAETIVSVQAESFSIRRNIVESIRELIYSDKGILKLRCPGVSVETLSELTMNAYIHRCWRTPGPIRVRIEDILETENPGELMPGLSPTNLLHCIPSYRNFLLAESCRYIGLCDKLGKGIGLVFEAALKGGLPIPVFESSENRFTARLSFTASDHFREFVRIRSASLSTTDEVLALRLLWERKTATMQEIAQVLQRGFEQTEAVLRLMEKKEMLTATDDGRFSVSTAVRSDIEQIFKAAQMDLFRA